MDTTNDTPAGRLLSDLPPDPALPEPCNDLNVLANITDRPRANFTADPPGGPVTESPNGSGWSQRRMRGQVSRQSAVLAAHRVGRRAFNYANDHAVRMLQQAAVEATRNGQHEAGRALATMAANLYVSGTDRADVMLLHHAPVWAEPEL